MLVLNDMAVGYRSRDDVSHLERETVIVRGISRSVLAGQRIGILGANGQGKSTLVKTIAKACRRWAAPPPKARAW
jgi:ATP-binding cassette subfamily F protein 3